MWGGKTAKGRKITRKKFEKYHVPDKEKSELEKRVVRIEGMVANLIVDQQVMVTSFNARGDRHKGSLDHHRTTLTALGRFQEKTDANINTLVDECRILQTQVESLGDSMCRWAQEETFCFRRFLPSCSLGVENTVVLGTGKMPWGMLMSTPKGLIIP